MMKTKDRILVTALSLFNQQGIAKVKLRTIAQEMGISQGNLNYHFKQRATIIEALYFQLVANIDQSISEIQLDQLNLKLMFDLQKVILNNFYNYRFFLLDFVHITRDHPKIRKHYLELSKQRQAQFTSLMAVLVAQKIMRAEQLPNEYQNLYIRFQILGDFWISSAEVSNSKITKKIIATYQEIIAQSIYPYLTAKGRKAYQLL